MAPTLYFIGTGTAETRGEISEGGFLLKQGALLLHVDPGVGAAYGLRKLKIDKVDALVVSSADRAHDARLITATQSIIGNANVGVIHVKRIDGGFLFQHTDGTIAYLVEPVKTLKGLSADVLILGTYSNEEKIITALQPKLVILTSYGSAQYTHGPVYLARELQKTTGVQTIAAQDGLTVDLDSYSALSAQKSLDKFREAA